MGDYLKSVSEANIDRSKLLKAIDQYFSQEELRTICFELGIEYEDLPALGKENKVRELVAWSERSARVEELLDICQQKRSEVDWFVFLESDDDATSSVKDFQSVVGSFEVIHWVAGVAVLILVVLLGIVLLNGRDETELAQHLVEGTATALAMTAEAEGDNDNDGLSNNRERSEGTDPENPDTDGDGLSDGQELNMYGTEPRVRDSDGDTLSDGEEVEEYGTSPTNRDSDGDGFLDGAEVRAGTDPLVAQSEEEATPSTTPTATGTPSPTTTPTPSSTPTMTPTFVPITLVPIVTLDNPVIISPFPPLPMIQVVTVSPNPGARVIPGTTFLRITVRYSFEATASIRPDFLAFVSEDCSDSSPMNLQAASPQDSEQGIVAPAASGEDLVLPSLIVPESLAEEPNARAVSFLVRLYREETGELLVTDDDYSSRCYPM